MIRRGLCSPSDPVEDVGMSRKRPLDYSTILAHLERDLEVEFTFIRAEDLAGCVADLERERQDFLLDWTRRAAATNTELAFQFAQRVIDILDRVGPEVIAAWCLHAMDSYDRSGLVAAMSVIRDLDGFLALGHQRAQGALFEDAAPVLSHFVQGLDGRRLRIEQAWTDGEVLYLPEIMAHLDNREDNFQLYKAHVAQLWAQTRCGTLNIDLAAIFGRYADPLRAQAVFHRLETARLDGFIARELPGLARTMQRLSVILDVDRQPAGWEQALEALQPPRCHLGRQSGLAGAYRTRQGPPAPDAARCGRRDRRGGRDPSSARCLRVEGEKRCARR